METDYQDRRDCPSLIHHHLHQVAILRDDVDFRSDFDHHLLLARAKH